MLAVPLFVAGQAPMTCQARDNEGRPCDNAQPHYHCAACSTVTPGNAGICAHHTVSVDEWAHANRTFCDLLHRGVEPPPVVLEPVPYEQHWDVA